jgi:hypothetical protein
MPARQRTKIMPMSVRWIIACPSWPAPDISSGGSLRSERADRPAIARFSRGAQAPTGFSCTVSMPPPVRGVAPIWRELRLISSTAATARLVGDARTSRLSGLVPGMTLPAPGETAISPTVIDQRGFAPGRRRPRPLS